MNCTKCGKEIEDGEDKVCEECKAKIVSEIEAAEKEEKVEKEVEEVNVVEEAAAEKEEVSEEKVEEKVEEKSEENSGEEKKKSDKKAVGIASGIVAVCLITVIAIIVCIVSFVTGLVEVPDTLKTNTVGNSTGNILNSGYGVEDNKYIYYIAPDSELVDICIYRANKDGSNIKELYRTKETLISLNAMGGDLFFLSLAQEYDNNGDVVINNKICRMSKDGKDFCVINDNEFHDYCYEIYVVKDRIYYIGEDVNVYTMDLYGGDRKLELDKERGYVAVTEDHIIYNEFIDEEKDPEKFETYIYFKETAESKVIVEDQKTYSTTILGDTVYYTDESGAIYKKNINDLAADPILLCDTEAYYMNATEEGIYYMNYTSPEDETISIFKVDLDGKNNVVLKTLESANGADFINIIGDWVMYTDSDGIELFMNLTNKNTGDNDVKVFKLNIQEYWQKYLESEETEVDDTLIDLDTTVDEVENKVENTVSTN